MAAANAWRVSLLNMYSEFSCFSYAAVRIALILCALCFGVYKSISTQYGDCVGFSLRLFGLGWIGLVQLYA